MKLRNKKTGDIVEFNNFYEVRGGKKQIVYDSLAEVNENWVDYEEPKEFWYIDSDGEILCEPADDRCKFDMDCKQIGNYFSTKEEAEKAVEKLKAWKRLKDKGVKIGKRRHSAYGGEMYWDCPNGAGISDKQIWLDLDLLFGGEE